MPAILAPALLSLAGQVGLKLVSGLARRFSEKPSPPSPSEFASLLDRPKGKGAAAEKRALTNDRGGEAPDLARVGGLPQRVDVERAQSAYDRSQVKELRWSHEPVQAP